MKILSSFKAVFFLSFISLFLTVGAQAVEKVILFGGGDYTPEAITQFVSWAGNKKAKILILPWATSSPVEEFESVKSLFTPFLPESIERGLAYDESGFDKKKLIQQVESASGIFFPGGDQVDLMARMNQYQEIRELLLRKYHSGVVFAGYSAGTAIASKTMLTGNGNDKQINSDNIETAEGLGLVENFIVDQHFIARKRQNRLISVLIKSKESIGIGIDEGMALVLEDGKKGWVLGDSMVMVFARKQFPNQFEMTLLKKGQRIVLP